MIITALKKDERGKYTGTVRVHGKKGTYTRTQRLGRKDTGKIASLPQEMKDTILDLRRQGYSAAKIIDHLEGALVKDNGNLIFLHSDPEKIKSARPKLDALDLEHRQLVKEDKNVSRRREILDERRKIIKENTNKIPIDKEATAGIISEEGKIKVTGQALTDWAAKRGVKSSKTKDKTTQAERDIHALKIEHEYTLKELGEVKVALREAKDYAEAQKKSIEQREEITSEMRKLIRNLQEENKKLKAEAAK